MKTAFSRKYWVTELKPRYAIRLICVLRRNYYGRVHRREDRARVLFMATHPGLVSGKHETTGMNVQVACMIAGALARTPIR